MLLRVTNWYLYCHWGRNGLHVYVPFDHVVADTVLSTNLICLIGSYMFSGIKNILGISEVSIVLNTGTKADKQV